MQTLHGFQNGGGAPRRAARALSLAAAAGLATGAFAGGGPESILVIVNPGSAESMYLGNYYKHVRGVPDSNILYLNPAAADHAALAGGNLPALFATLEERGVGHVDYILVTPGGPFAMKASSEIKDGCFEVSKFAVASGYTMAFVAGEVLEGVPVSTLNRFYAPGATMPAFDSAVTYLGGVPSNDEKARRYFIGAMLGYTGERGNTVEQIKDLIDRSAGADGTRPGGTFYFMDNQADPPRNVRAPQFDNAVNTIVGLGGAAGKIQGVLPLGKHDALGIMTGAANPNVLNGNFTLVAGAFADHLTSYAGAFDVDAQTKMSDWITKGASGSLGAVEEPCNYTGKFPHARTHQYYLQGATLGEAYFRAAQYVPFQMLLYGDPLTRAFAYIPAVAVPDAPGDAVSGTVKITPQATTDHPDAFVLALELFIDGRPTDLTIPGGFFSIDTTALDDGHHDLRVVAYDSTSLKTQGNWVGSLVVNNKGRGATVAAKSAKGDLGSMFEFDVAGSGGQVKEVRLLQSGRVVASVPGGSGTARVFGQTLGAGPSAVQAEALFADGRTARSAPVSVEVKFAGATGGAEPVAFGYTRGVAPGATALVSLPATFDDDPALAAYTVVSGPDQASILMNDGAAYILVAASADAAGTDTIVFRAITPGGLSDPAMITLDYGDGGVPGCPPDLNGDGKLDIFDFLTFVNSFNSGNPAADCDGSGGLGIFDFFCFVNQFNQGC